MIYLDQVSLDQIAKMYDIGIAAASSGSEYDVVLKLDDGTGDYALDLFSLTLSTNIYLSGHALPHGKPK